MNEIRKCGCQKTNSDILFCKYHLKEIDQLEKENESLYEDGEYIGDVE